MSQERLAQITKKAIELPIEFTQKLLENTERVRTPSPRVDRIGRTIGVCIGIGLLLTGGVSLLVGKYTWAIGSVSAGGLTVISNLISHNSDKKQK